MDQCQPHQTLKRIGAVLQEHRHRLGLSYATVEAATFIRAKYLRALEEGRESDLPAEFYLKGFLRLYSSYLGLNASALVTEFTQGRRGCEELDEVGCRTPDPVVIRSPLHWLRLPFRSRGPGRLT